MDILKKYEEENPEISPQVPEWESFEEYRGLIRFVIRFSGGRIQDEKQANLVLVVVTILMVTLSLFFFLRLGGPTLPSAFEMLRDTPTTGLRHGAIVP
ncbi:MAG: hypothetical protein AAB972_03135 [Patescibacteria group bacterium]|mgnify:FL=1